MATKKTKKTTAKKAAPKKAKAAPSKAPPKKAAAKKGKSAANVEARWGFPLPDRLKRFFDEECGAFADHQLHGLPQNGMATRFKLRWQSGELEMFLDYAEHVAGKKPGWLPLAAVGAEQTCFVAVDTASAGWPVHYFDYESGYQLHAASFDSFLENLLAKGEKSPVEKMKQAYDKAKGLIDKKKYQDALALLAPWEAKLPNVRPRGIDDHDDYPGGIANLMGICASQLAGERDKGPVDDTLKRRAISLYEKAAFLGDDTAILNLCDLDLNHFKDVDGMIARAEEARKHVWNIGGGYAWFHLRNYLGLAYLRKGRNDDALLAYHQIWQANREEERARIDEAVGGIRDLIKEGGAVDVEFANGIVAWLGAPLLTAEQSAAQRAEWRRWWDGLPEQLRERLGSRHLDREDPSTKKGKAQAARPLSDDEVDVFARITSVEVRDAGVTSLDHFRIFKRATTLDVENNAVVDIGAVNDLPFLKRLKLTQNPVTSLAAIAGHGRLDNVDISKTAINSLDGIDLPALEGLRANHLEVSDVTPLVTGTPRLGELCIYAGKVKDLRPLKGLRSLKRLNVSFGAPPTGLMDLVDLPLLEKVEGVDQALDLARFKKARPDVAIGWQDADGVDIDDAVVLAWWRGLRGGWRLKAAKLVQSAADDDDDAPKAKKKARAANDEPLPRHIGKALREDSLHFDKAGLDRSAPLAAFTRCDWLNLDENTALAEIDGVAGLWRLRFLRLSHTQVTDLTPLRGLSLLDRLDLSDTGVADLDAVPTAALTELELNRTPVSSLAPLSTATALQELSAAHTAVSSLAPLRGLRQLREVDVAATKVSDLSPLSQCPSLETVQAFSCPGLTGLITLAPLKFLREVCTHGSASPAEIAALRAARPDVIVD